MSGRIIGRIVHDEDAHVLSITTMTILVATRGARIIESWEEIGKFRIGGSIHEPSMDTMNDIIQSFVIDRSINELFNVCRADRCVLGKGGDVVRHVSYS